MSDEIRELRNEIIALKEINGKLEGKIIELMENIDKLKEETESLKTEKAQAEFKVKEQQLMATAANSMAEPANSFQHKEHRKDNVVSAEIELPESPCQQQQIRNGQQQNSIKISNTYCGPTGPVPNTRSVENSPAAQLAIDRRAISQIELPLHLCLKTKQRRCR